MNNLTLEKRYLGNSTYAEAPRVQRTAYAECCIKRIKRKAEKVLGKYIVTILTTYPDIVETDIRNNVEYSIMFGKLRHFAVTGAGDHRAVINSSGGCSINLFKGIEDYTYFHVGVHDIDYNVRNITTYRALSVDTNRIPEHSWISNLIGWDKDDIDDCHIVSEETINKVKGLIRGIISSPKDFVTIFNQIIAAVAA